MKRTILVVVSLLVIGLVSAGLVSAYKFNSKEKGTHFEEMEKIVENGNYEDLIDFRESNEGFGGPRWINSQEDFIEWQEMHKDMENKGYTKGYGRHSGCPMLD